MIVFDKLWTVMERRGVSTYQLREKCGIDSKTIRRLRANDNMETKTLNKLCAVLHCRLEDIAEYVEEFSVNFGYNSEELLSGNFYKLTPNTASPYKQLYTHN